MARTALNQVINAHANGRERDWIFLYQIGDTLMVKPACNGSVVRVQFDSNRNNFLVAACKSNQSFTFIKVNTPQNVLLAVDQIRLCDDVKQPIRKPHPTIV